MRSYPDDYLNQIICGDCLDLMKEIPDKSIDLILTDPPYGLNIAKSGCLSIKGASSVKKEFTKSDWDVKPERKYFDEMIRISKNQIIWGGNFFTDYLPPSQCWLVWYKKDGLPNKMFADCELAWTSFKKPAKLFNSRWHGFIRDSREKRQPHPTQKALDLFSWCLDNFSKPGDIILDPFLGSGTAAEACIKKGVKYIGIEISDEYCGVSKTRINS